MDQDPKSAYPISGASFMSCFFWWFIILMPVCVALPYLLGRDDRDESGPGDAGRHPVSPCGHDNPPQARYCRICGIPLRGRHS